MSRVDMITAAISSVRVGRVSGRRITEAGPLGLRIPAMPILGFHVSLTGESWLITEHAPPVAVRAGDVVFVTAGAEHGLARMPCTLGELPMIEMADVPPPPAPADFEFLCGSYPLQQGRVPGFLRHLPDVVAFTPDYDRHPELRSVVTMLADDYTRAGPGSGATRGALVDLMIVHILRHLQEHADPRDRPVTAGPGIAEALHEIHEHPERAWTVQQLSGVAGMSRAAFTRQFRQAVGAAPMAYLTDWRLDTAARLLQETTVPLAAVARRIGYSTPFAFTTAFRRRYGVPPGRYRAGVSSRPG
jgi:AraC-like DNA-binding protein